MTLLPLVPLPEVRCPSCSLLMRYTGKKCRADGSIQAQRFQCFPCGTSASRDFTGAQPTVTYRPAVCKHCGYPTDQCLRSGPGRFCCPDCSCKRWGLLKT